MKASEKTPAECAFHLDNVGEVCTGCGEEIDDYGNTPGRFEYCSFPNCGCDGSQHCMAGEPNSCSVSINFEQGSFKP